MAEDYHAYWQRKAEERTAARQNLTRAAAPAETVAAPAAGPTPGQIATAERERNLAAAGTELGAPTSYGGGRRAVAPEIPAGELSTDAGGFDPSKASFSNPIHVIRRMGQTWTGPGPGEEQRTLQQAKQAFNRAAGMGAPGGPEGTGYIPPEGPGYEAKAAAEYGKRPDLVALAEARKAQLAKDTADEHVATLKNYVTTSHGTFDKESGRTVFKPTDEGMSRDYMAAEELAKREGAPVAITHFDERQMARKYLASRPAPKGFDVNAYLGAVSKSPKAWGDLVKQGREIADREKVTAPPSAEPENLSLGQQSKLLWAAAGRGGRAITPTWMRPKEWTPPGL